MGLSVGQYSDYAAVFLTKYLKNSTNFRYFIYIFKIYWLFYSQEPPSKGVTRYIYWNRENSSMTLDKIDRKILTALQADAGISNLELAAHVGLSATPCARRVKQLQDSGIIRGQVTLLDESKLGLKLTAIISISMDRHTPDRFENFESRVATFPEVIECSIVTGQAADYLLKAVLPDMEYFEEFLLGRLTKIEGVTGVHSSFVLRKVITKTELPLQHVV